MTNYPWIDVTEITAWISSKFDLFSMSQVCILEPGTYFDMEARDLLGCRGGWGGFFIDISILCKKIIFLHTFVIVQAN